MIKELRYFWNVLRRIRAWLDQLEDDALETYNEDRSRR